MLKRLKRKSLNPNESLTAGQIKSLESTSPPKSSFDGSPPFPSSPNGAKRTTSFSTLPHNFSKQHPSEVLSILSLEAPSYSAPPIERTSSGMPIDRRKRTSSGGEATMYAVHTDDDVETRPVSSSRRAKRLSLPAAAIGKLNPFAKQGEDEDTQKERRERGIATSAPAKAGGDEEADNTLWRTARNTDEENEILRKQVTELQIKVSMQQKEIEYHKKAAKQLSAELDSLKAKINSLQKPAEPVPQNKEPPSAPDSTTTPRPEGDPQDPKAARRSKLMAYLKYSNLEFPEDATDIRKKPNQTPESSPAKDADLPAIITSAPPEDADQVDPTPRKVFHQRKRKKGSLLNFIREDKKSVINPFGARQSTVKPLVTPAPGYCLEQEVSYDWQHAGFVLERESWYEQYFYRFAHRNFIGVETPLGTVVVSAKKEDTKSSPGNSFYRVVLLTQDGDQNLLIPSNTVEVSGFASSFKLLHAINPLLLSTGKIKEITNPALPKALMDWETKDRPKKYKFGLLLVKEGQTLETEMFSNKDGSEDYQEFLDVIGNEVKLEGWPHFAAGLDVKSNTTGTHSRYIKWKENQIMWHVSTYLPFSDVNSQQLERKRHLGNDIVLVVFLDGNVQFAPKTVNSHFIHNIIAVRRLREPLDTPNNNSSSNSNNTNKEESPAEGGGAEEKKVYKYQISISSRDDVPLFGPPLPKPPIFTFTDREAFRDFFFAKLINSESAAQTSFYFSKKLRLGRRAILNDLALTFFPESDDTDVLA